MSAIRSSNSFVPFGANAQGRDGYPIVMCFLGHVQAALFIAIGLAIGEQNQVANDWLARKTLEFFQPFCQAPADLRSPALAQALYSGDHNIGNLLGIGAHNDFGAVIKCDDGEDVAGLKAFNERAAGPF